MKCRELVEKQTCYCTKGAQCATTISIPTQLTQFVERWVSQTQRVDLTVGMNIAFSQIIISRWMTCDAAQGTGPTAPSQKLTTAGTMKTFSLPVMFQPNPQSQVGLIPLYGGMQQSISRIVGRGTQMTVHSHYVCIIAMK